MAPPSATEPATSTSENGSKNGGNATLEPGLDKGQAKESEKSMREHGMSFPGPKAFTDKYEEREYMKGRLALAFRIFAKQGFDEGVAGHITLRVSAREEGVGPLA